VGLSVFDILPGVGDLALILVDMDVSGEEVLQLIDVGQVNPDCLS